MKTLKLALVAALAMPTFNVLAEEEASSEHSVSYNVGLFSEYIFRGYSQTHNDPALQGGVDYEHSSGLYLGLWASNISWLRDAGSSDSGHSLEVDVYGGYAGEIGDTGIGYDVGFLQYWYPGEMSSTVAAANTFELYAGLSYKDLSVTYYEVMSKDAWTWGDTAAGGADDDAKGSFYLSVDYEHDVGQYLNISGLTANIHAGHQNFAGAANNDYSYTDWLVGIDKEVLGLNAGLQFITTNIDEDLGAWPQANRSGESRWVGYVSKTF
jgi:uncharacterized protein (TIGR02001 family)